MGNCDKLPPLLGECALNLHFPEIFRRSEAPQLAKIQTAISRAGTRNNQLGSATFPPDADRHRPALALGVVYIH